MKFTIMILMFTCCHVKLMFLFTFTKWGLVTGEGDVNVKVAMIFDVV